MWEGKSKSLSIPYESDPHAQCVRASLYFSASWTNSLKPAGTKLTADLAVAGKYLMLHCFM